MKLNKRMDEEGEGDADGVFLKSYGSGADTSPPLLAFMLVR